MLRKELITKNFLFNLFPCLFISLMIVGTKFANFFVYADELSLPPDLFLFIMGTISQFIVVKLISKRFPIARELQLQILVMTNVLTVSILLAGVFLLFYFIMLFTFGLGPTFHPGD